MSLRANLAVIVCALGLGACGDEQDEPARSTVAATPAETATATPTATATATPSATPTATPEATAEPEVEPETGDERGNRVPFELTLAVEDVIPAEVRVPAFLGLRVTVTNESGAERRLLLDDETVLEILPGAKEKIELEGLQPGRHVLDAGESGRATIIAERSGE